MAKPKTIAVTLTPLDERLQLEKLLSAAYESALIVDDYEVSALGVFSGMAIDESNDDAEIPFQFNPGTESIDFGGDLDEPIED